MENVMGFFNSIATKEGMIAIATVLVIIALVIVLGKRKVQLSTTAVVAIGVGSALYAAISFISIPIGPNTSFRIAVALLTIFGALYGPIVGFLVGFIGHALNDALAWGSVWWSWVFLSAIIGLFAGFVFSDKSYNPLKGKLTKSHIIKLYVYSVVSIVPASLIAYAGDVFLYGEPADKVLLQIVVAAASNVAVVCVVGIPAVMTIAKLRSSEKNLKEE